MLSDSDYKFAIEPMIMSGGTLQWRHHLATAMADSDVTDGVWVKP